MGKEIEKKFIINELPNNIKLKNGKEIHQTYLATGKEEIRVRKLMTKKETTFTMTIKKGEGLVREEIEFDITEGTYQQLLLNSNKTPIIKKRHKIELDEHKFDFDQYSNLNVVGLKTIEVEFESEQAASKFVKPEWFGKEVTEDKKYKNQNLWLSLNIKN
jgi:CYTH domain-containing protein